MENIKKLKIGNYVLTFDKILRKFIKYFDMDMWADHYEGSKTFKNIEDYKKFCRYLNNNWNVGGGRNTRDIISYDGLIICLYRDSTLTINFEMYDDRELGMEYCEIKGDIEREKEGN